VAVRQAALVSDESALDARDDALYKLTTFIFLHGNYCIGYRRHRCDAFSEAPSKCSPLVK